MADGEPVPNPHHAAAVAAIRAWAAESNCGACAGVLEAEVEHLDLVAEVYEKAGVLASVQEEASGEFRDEAEKADAALREAGVDRPPLPSARPGLGIVDHVAEIWRSRVRFTEILNVGRR